MTLKEKYEFIKENVAKQPVGTFIIYELEDLPSFINDTEKSKELVGNYTFGIELTDKATEQDYYDYIKFVTNYTGTQNMFPI